MDLQEIYKELNLSPEQLRELSEAVKVSPMAAVSLIQKYNIRPEVIQKIAGILMSNPGALKTLVAEAGLPKDALDQAHSCFSAWKGPPEKS